MQYLPMFIGKIFFLVLLNEIIENDIESINVFVSCALYFFMNTTIFLMELL